MLTEQVAAVKLDLERLLAIATVLDLATARARYSLWLNANPPRFIEFSPEASAEAIVLRQLRHPLLVWQQQHEQGTTVVPTDLIIQPQIRVVAITGPNTGGKTVTLKTLGLAVLMAKVGLFIPAREPVELPWFDQILADIGDEQSLQQSLSTFSGHIRRISRILAAIAPAPQPVTESEAEEVPVEPPANALILLDEVGAGTDPSEGSALAIALLQHLANHAALTIATTHFGELKALKYQDDRFENASVEFNDVTLSPTYRLLWGIPGRSNALTIAQRLGLSRAIVRQAQGYVGAGSDQDVNKIIAGLEAQRRKQEEKLKTREVSQRDGAALSRSLPQGGSAARSRTRASAAAGEKAIQQAIAEAKSEIAQVIRRLQQGTPTAQDAQQATEGLNQIADRLPSRQPPPKPKPGFMPKVGDRVRIPRVGQTAEVLSNPDANGELSVRFGLMKMTVALTDVESLQGEKVELPPKPKPVEPLAPAAPPPLLPHFQKYDRYSRQSGRRCGTGLRPGNCQSRSRLMDYSRSWHG